MPRIKITDSEGTELFGTLPSSWANTPLAPYAALASATTMGERCTAVAQLLGLPAEPFLSDVSLLAPIHRAAPWLFDGSLPDAGTEAVPAFTHEGTEYRHVGNLMQVSAEQMEAVLNFIQEYEGKVLAAAPALLAVLYCPAGQPQTGPVVAATAKAFVTLPVATAWPALQAFLRSSASAALRIRTASALVDQVSSLLRTLEAATAPTGTGSRISFLNMRRWLTRQWARHALKSLT